MVGFGGMQHSVEEMLSEIGAELASQLLMDVGSRWQLHEYRQILIAGGGAFRIGARLVEALPSAVVLDDPASANVRGYLGFGRRVQASRVEAGEDELDDLGDLEFELDRIEAVSRGES